MKPIKCIICIICIINYVVASAFTINKEYLKYFLSEEDDLPKTHIYITSKSREKRSPNYVEKPGHLELHVEDDKGEFDIVLKPNSNLISPLYTLVVRGENGTIEENLESHSKSCLFVGSIKNREDLPVALSNCDGKGFTGVIVDEEKTHFVHPVNKSRRKRDTLTSDGLHVVKTKSGNGKCGVLNAEAMTASDVIVELISSKTPTETKEQIKSEKLLDNSELLRKYQIETAVFVDDEMYKHIQRTTSETDVIKAIEDIVFAIMNGVALLYDAPSMKLDIDIVLMHLDIMKRPDPKLDKFDGEIMQYLNSFCRWQADQNFILETGSVTKVSNIWDHAILITGLELYDRVPQDDEVIGLAWVSGMCRSQYSCTINQGTTFEAVYIITHEMGHNLGMTHDGAVENGNNCPKNSHIMSASTGPGKVTWSVCSNREIEKFLTSSRHDTSCLRRSRQSKKVNFHTGETLPGEHFNKEAQCAFNYGPKHKPYISSSHPYDNICRELWCENGTHAMLSHPALEGTPCNRGRGICISGACLAKNVEVPNTAENEIPIINQSPRADDFPSNNFGFSSLFSRITDLFRKYLSLRSSESSIPLPKEWVLLDMKPCSASCGGGWSNGVVSCVRGGIVIDEKECNTSTKPPSRTTCNTMPCINTYT